MIRDLLFFLFVNRARDPPLYNPLHLKEKTITPFENFEAAVYFRGSLVTISQKCKHTKKLRLVTKSCVNTVDFLKALKIMP